MVKHLQDLSNMSQSENHLWVFHMCWWENMKNTTVHILNTTKSTVNLLTHFYNMRASFSVQTLRFIVSDEAQVYEALLWSKHNLGHLQHASTDNSPRWNLDYLQPPFGQCGSQVVVMTWDSDSDSTLLSLTEYITQTMKWSLTSRSVSTNSSEKVPYIHTYLHPE